jgi:hypothetical protein
MIRKLLRPLVGPPSLVDRPQGAKKARAVMGRLLEPLDPARRAAGALEATPYAVLSVYRRRNAARLGQLLSAVRPTGIHLWALDSVDPDLAGHTAGFGPGLRLELLNQLATRIEEPDQWLVILDDDVSFTTGSPAALVAIARRAGLDLSQPAHSRWSHLNWEVTRHRVGSIARLTRFVDQGPVLALSPKARETLLPFTDLNGMSWGVEAMWSRHDQLKIGIVDAVTVRHLAPAGSAGYNVAEEWSRANGSLRRAGYSSWSELQRELSRWRYPSPRPPW